MMPKDWAEVTDEILQAMKSEASPLFIFGLLVLMRRYPLDTMHAISHACIRYKKEKDNG